MAKHAISVTLDADNLAWLRGRRGAAGVRSVSELLDRIVTGARNTKQIGPSRSVVGTIVIAPEDPNLDTADAAIQTIYARSLQRPWVVRETSRARPAARAVKRRRV